MARRGEMRSSLERKTEDPRNLGRKEGYDGLCTLKGQSPHPCSSLLYPQYLGQCPAQGKYLVNLMNEWNEQMNLP